MNIIRIGTRTSKLAIIQTQLVCDGVRQHHPEWAFDVIGFTTSGDKNRTRPLYEIGGKGLFVGELDEALHTGIIDAAVHSLKDIPSELDQGISIAGVSPREDPRDALVLPSTATSVPDPYDAEAIVWWLTHHHLTLGCSSARRRVELMRLYPGIPLAPVRGNVTTRLNKLDQGEFGALVLAVAGLKRLGLDERISRPFDPDEMLPSAGQGVMAITVCTGSDATWLKGYADEEVAMCVRAERGFTRALGADCTTPCAAFATFEGDSIYLRGLYATPDAAIYQRIEGRVSCEHPEEDAYMLAQQVMSA